MIMTILLVIVLLAIFAGVVFFCLPRFLENVEELVIDLAADALNHIQDARDEWKDLFQRLREGRDE